MKWGTNVKRMETYGQKHEGSRIEFMEETGMESMQETEGHFECYSFKSFIAFYFQ